MPEDFWRNLLEDFYQLRKECAFNPPNQNEGRLFAVWMAQPAPNRWVLRYEGGRDWDHSGFTRRFAWLAGKAVTRMGFDQAEFDSVSIWLDQIKRDAPESLSYPIVFRGPDFSEREYSKEIRDVCYWSAHYCDKCCADEERSQAVVFSDKADQRSREAGMPPQGIAEGAVVNPFRRDAKKHHEMLAHWDSGEELWTFRESVDKFGNPIPGPSDMPAGLKTAGLFKEAAQIALGLLKNSRDADIRERIGTLREPVQVWLDLMREKQRGFRRILKPFVATQYWQMMAPEGLLDVFPLGEDGSISNVFEESADFWDDIAARAFELEVAGGGTNGRTVEPVAVRITIPPKSETERKDLASQVVLNGSTADRRAAVDTFISKLAEAGHRITRTNIWTVAGYTHRTEFERFQRGDTRTTRSAASSFNRVLGMKPEDFVMALQKRKASK